MKKMPPWPTSALRDYYQGLKVQNKSQRRESIRALLEEGQLIGRLVLESIRHYRAFTPMDGNLMYRVPRTPLRNAANIQGPQDVNGDDDLIPLVWGNGVQTVIGNHDSDFEFVFYELKPSNVSGGLMSPDGTTRRPLSIDWILAAQADRRPILAEVKLGDFEPCLHLIQALAQAVELIPPNQAQRMKDQLAQHPDGPLPDVQLPEAIEVQGVVGVPLDVFLVAFQPAVRGAAAAALPLVVNLVEAIRDSAAGAFFPRIEFLRADLVGGADGHSLSFSRGWN